MKATSWLRFGLAVCSLLPTISGYAIRDSRAVIVERGIIVTYVADPAAFKHKFSKRQDNNNQGTTEPPQSKSQSNKASPSQTNLNSDIFSETSAPASSSAAKSKEGPTHTEPAPTITGADAAAATSQVPDKNGLPYTPPLTPAFAFAGFLLLVAGVPYTLAGVRHKQIHIFLSTALLASLGVSVLIIYVMNPPVSNGLQGGYVAAVAITGLIFGGLAVIFPEVTEVLACLLGGFCLAQWFLVLKPGGLVQGGYQKIIFILCFSIGLFCLALHHYTRPYGMIFSIAFSGATVTVLGIDFFSRAGLKEFWLYVWGLNDNIFPLDTTTFPMTRGIRVEIAAIIVITCFGIISQMKLWQVIKLKREEREETRQKRQADLEAMEEENGRRVEQAAQRDREIWEKQYGDKANTTTASVEESPNASAELKQKKHLSHDSGLGNSSKNSTDGNSSKIEDSIEMVGLRQVAEGVAATQEVPVPPHAREGESLQILPVSESGKTENRPASTSGAGPAPEATPAAPPVPQFFTPAVVIREKGDIDEPETTKSVTGLAAPLAVHTVIIDPTNDKDDDDASSLATFADSVRDDKRKSQAISIASIAPLDDIQEIPHDDAASSVCGVLDDEEEERSEDELPLVGEGVGKRRSILSLNSRRGSWSSNKRLSVISLGRKNSQRSTKSNGPASPKLESPVESLHEKLFGPSLEPEARDTSSILGSEKAGSRRASLTPPVEAAISEAGEKTKPEDLPIPPSRRPSAASSIRPEEVGSVAGKSESESPRPKSKKEAKAAVVGPPAPLRHGSLQHVRPPSKVVKTYRVSEWAKHLDPADEPQYDEMELEEADAVQEKAAPVHVMELQEGASSAKVPPPIIGLTKSDTFNSMQAGTVSRSNTLTTIREAPGFVQPYQIPQIVSPILAPTSPQIPTVVVASPPPSRASMLPLSSPILSQPLVESPTEEGEINLEQRTTSPPPQPLIPVTETLLGKRESMLKATPNFPTVADNTMVYGQAMTQPQPFQNFNAASASSPNLLYRQSMTPTLPGGGYQSHRNSNGTSYAGSLGGYGGTSSRIPSMEVPPGALAGYSPYMSQLNHSLPSVAIPVPQGAVEMAPQAPPQPAPADRRESMLRKWRESLAQDQVISARSKHTMHDRRNEMIQHQALMNAYEKQKEMERGMRDGIVDERFKQRDMLQVHREAMKKMQDKAKGI